MKAASQFIPNWYYVGTSSSLNSKRPTRLKVGEREWVGYRDENGKAIVLDPRCPHMGTDLSTGEICEGKLQCPLHRWEFKSDGRCASVPGLKEPPNFAFLRTYPVQERHGKIFVFSQSQIKFNLPFFEGENPDEFRCSSPIHLEADCNWQIVSANAFDVYHFEQFHGRKLLADPLLTRPASEAYRIQHRFEIVKPSLFDRLLILADGKIGHFDYTSWQGCFVLLKVRFDSITNYLQIVFHPLPNDRCGIDIFVLEKKGFHFKIPLFLKRKMTDLFFRPESESLRKVYFNPATSIAMDEPLRDYLQWLSELSGGATPPGPG